MNRSIEDLLARINEENIDNDFIQDLIIFNEEKRKDPNEPLISKEYEFLKDIHSTSLPSRKIGARFSNEQLLEMKMLISKHQADELLIRKALKIPPSTFSRLKRKIDKENWQRNKIVSRND